MKKALENLTKEGYKTMWELEEMKNDIILTTDDIIDILDYMSDILMDNGHEDARRTLDIIRETIEDYEEK